MYIVLRSADPNLLRGRVRPVSARDDNAIYDFSIRHCYSSLGFKKEFKSKIKEKGNYEEYT